MSSSLTWKVALLLAVPSCGALLSLAIFWSFHAQTDPASIHLAVQQRLRTMHVGQWAGMVAAGHDEDRTALRAEIASFDATLTALEQGGRVDGESVRAPDGSAPAIAGVREVWGDVRPQLLVIADQPSSSPEFSEPGERPLQTSTNCGPAPTTSPVYWRRRATRPGFGF